MIRLSTGGAVPIRDGTQGRNRPDVLLTDWSYGDLNPKFNHAMVA